MQKRDTAWLINRKKKNHFPTRFHSTLQQICSKYGYTTGNKTQDSYEKGPHWLQISSAKSLGSICSSGWGWNTHVLGNLRETRNFSVELFFFFSSSPYRFLEKNPRRQGWNFILFIFFFLWRLSSETELHIELTKLRWLLQALLIPVLKDDLFFSDSKLAFSSRNNESIWYIYHFVLTSSPVLSQTYNTHFKSLVLTRCF